MTVGELREKLAYYPSNMEIVFYDADDVSYNVDLQERQVRVDCPGQDFHDVDTYYVTLLNVVVEKA